jgi:hypothetical protein
MKLREEEILQAQCVSLFGFLNLNQKVEIYSNRNESGKGGKKGTKEYLNALISGSNYKKMGRVSGVPDLSILWKGGNAFIELKTKKAYFTEKGKVTKSRGLSESQIEFHKKLEALDIPVFVAYDLESFQDVFTKLNLL